VYKQFTSLTEAFLDYFDIDLVTSARQQDQIGRIRYRVYCEEFDYYPAKDFPRRLETDQYDEYALQCLITHRRSKRAAGCVRVICPSEEYLLPLENDCLNSVHLGYMDTLTEDRSQICELSRWAVDAAFRRRPGEDHTRLGEFDAMDCCHQELRSFSLVGMAAGLAGFALASIADRSHVFAMMDNNLPRLLRRGGILVQKAGDTMEYHGQRAPYFITTHLARENMRDDLHLLYDAIHERLAFGYHARDGVNYAKMA
jgi:N-acyl amino acid synthase of PEP-CTERM/exosortase system